MCEHWKVHFLPFCLDPPLGQLNTPHPPRSLPLPPSSYLTSRHNDQCQYNCSPKKIRGNPQNKLGKTLSKGKFILLQERPCIICFFQDRNVYRFIDAVTVTLKDLFNFSTWGNTLLQQSRKKTACMGEIKGRQDASWWYCQLLEGISLSSNDT